MSKDLLFLDCDGVINHHAWDIIFKRERPKEDFEIDELRSLVRKTDPYTMRILKYALDTIEKNDVDLKIIIHSASWRYYEPENIKSWFTRYNITTEFAISFHGDRKARIENYLRDNSHGKWLVLDDYHVFDEQNHSNQILIDPRVGFTYINAIDTILHFCPDWNPPVIFC